jgi:hypothetical protein
MPPTKRQRQGTRRHKRKQTKRKQTKRSHIKQSQTKRSQTKQSQIKRSQTKRSQTKRSQTKRSQFKQGTRKHKQIKRRQSGGTELTLGQTVPFCLPSFSFKGTVQEVVPNGHGLIGIPSVVNNTGDAVYIIRIQEYKEWNRIMRCGDLIKELEDKKYYYDKDKKPLKQEGLDFYKNVFSSSWVESVFRNYTEISYAPDWEKAVLFSNDILWKFMFDLEKKQKEIYSETKYKYTFPYFPKLNKIKQCDETDTDDETKYDEDEVNKFLNAFYNFTPRERVLDMKKDENLYLYADVPDAPKAKQAFFGKIFKKITETPAEKYFVKFYDIIKNGEAYKVGGDGAEVINNTGKNVFIVKIIYQENRPNKAANLTWINKQTPGQSSIIFDASLNLFPRSFNSILKNKTFLPLLPLKNNIIDIELDTKKNIEKGYFPVFGGHNLKLMREISGLDDELVEPKEIPDEYDDSELKFFYNFYNLEIPEEKFVSTFEEMANPV